jgi:hypothetical protein
MCGGDGNRLLDRRAHLRRARVVLPGEFDRVTVRGRLTVFAFVVFGLRFVVLAT